MTIFNNFVSFFMWFGSGNHVSDPCAGGDFKRPVDTIVAQNIVQELWALANEALVSRSIGQQI
jgi:hypothetical protein